MYEIDFELSGNAKQTLSWMLVAELLKFMKGPQAILVTHPFDGHYDCLTVSSPNEKQQVLLNRLGSTALAHDELVEFIWQRAAYSPRETALHIMSQASLPAGDSAILNMGAITGATRIAQFLAEDMSEAGQVVWAWDEHLEGDAEHNLMGEFTVPDEWRAFEPPTRSTSWAAWIYILCNAKGPHALVNLKTGETLGKSGRTSIGLRNSWIKDDDGYPTTAIAYLLTTKFPGQVTSSTEIVRPALASGMFRNHHEEGDEAETSPLTSLATMEDVKTAWLSIRALSNLDDYFG